MSLNVRFALLGILAGIPAAQAQVHMCTDANGRKVYSDEPCGKDSKIIDARPGMGGPSINPGTSLRIEHYEIRGTSWDELRREIASKGPEGWWGRAQTGIRYEIEGRGEPDGCVVASAHVQMDAKVRLPMWANRYEGSRALQETWDGAFRTLDLHERGHVSISLDGAREIERDLNSIAMQPTCEALKAEARRRFDALHATIVSRQAHYDFVTNHGLEQWTPYKDRKR